MAIWTSVSGLASCQAPRGKQTVPWANWLVEASQLAWVVSEPAKKPSPKEAKLRANIDIITTLVEVTHMGGP